MNGIALFSSVYSYATSFFYCRVVCEVESLVSITESLLYLLINSVAFKKNFNLFCDLLTLKCGSYNCVTTIFWRKVVFCHLGQDLHCDLLHNFEPVLKWPGTAHFALQFSTIKIFWMACRVLCCTYKWIPDVSKLGRWSLEGEVSMAD